MLAGHSMGGMTIMAAALRERVVSRAGGVLLASTGAANLIADALALPFGAFIPPFVMLQHWLLTSAAPLGPFSPLTRPLIGYVTLGPDAPASGPRPSSILHPPPLHSSPYPPPTPSPPPPPPRLAGLTELSRIGHMTPLEAPRVVAGLIRKLAAGYRDARVSGVPPPPGRLHGRTAVVTGAARGIGAVLALRLAREGACIAAVGLEPENLSATKTRCAAHAPARAWTRGRDRSRPDAHGGRGRPGRGRGR